MINEQMLELLVLNQIVCKKLYVNYDKYDRKSIFRRYVTLKQAFLQPYEKDSNAKAK